MQISGSGFPRRLRILFNLKVGKLTALMFALATSLASAMVAGHNIIDVIALPPYTPNISVTYRWESLTFLYSELILLIIGESLVLLFLGSQINNMLPGRKRVI